MTITMMNDNHNEYQYDIEFDTISIIEWVSVWVSHSPWLSVWLSTSSITLFYEFYTIDVVLILWMGLRKWNNIKNDNVHYI